MDLIVSCIPASVLYFTISFLFEKGVINRYFNVMDDYSYINFYFPFIGLNLPDKYLLRVDYQGLYSLIQTLIVGVIVLRIIAAVVAVSGLVILMLFHR